MPSAGADNPAGPGCVNEEASRAEARADAEREFATRQDWAANQRSRPDEAAWPSASNRDDRVQPIEVTHPLVLVRSAADDGRRRRPRRPRRVCCHRNRRGHSPRREPGRLENCRCGYPRRAVAARSVLVYAGVLVLGEVDWAVEKLGAESAYGWIPIVAGVTAIVSALLTPRRHQRMTGVPTIAATT